MHKDCWYFHAGEKFVRTKKWERHTELDTDQIMIYDLNRDRFLQTK